MTAEGFYNIEKRSIAIALRITPPVAPNSFKRYVGDTYSRFNDKPSSETFFGILNSQETRIQFTADYENDEKELSRCYCKEYKNKRVFFLIISKRRHNEFSN